MLKISNLCFSYNKNCPYLLENINLNIEKGWYISIMGENGCGKSTLSKLILGFLSPNKGSIKLSTDNIAYVPQKYDSFNIDFPITVKEFLECHRKVLKIKDKNAAIEALKKVNMTGYLNSLIGNLSGGQRQKIFIARALMGNPELLILDEPSTGIDIPSQKEIYSFIKSLNKENNLTVISIEHNLEAALANSSHMYLINEGKGKLYTISEFTSLRKEKMLNAAI